MIDEKKLIKRIESEYRLWGEDYDAMQILGDIEDMPKVGGWIPCSERLPDEEEFKTAYCRNHYGGEFIVMIDGADRPTTLYYTSKGYWVDDCRKQYNVTAWQPLPEPWEGENDEIHTNK